MFQVRNTSGWWVAIAGVTLGAMPTAGRAAYLATAQQVGNDVVITGSGTLILSNPFSGSTNSASVIEPSSGTFSVGPRETTFTKLYFPTGFKGPGSFGSGAYHVADSGSGGLVQLHPNGGTVAVPQGYVLGSPLSQSSTYAAQTLASLGMSPGTYTWSWGSGDTADSFELDVITPSPEPGSALLLAAGVGALAARRPRRR